ncbi:unnamed protein product [Mytilus edulis]|uniref:Uncharacterized protein n=1 Tax=Mytilus edulis TaxID=6550 RepID=A0A8S3UDS6_MYTED|nr:unnamed protein product [Mytilus edulis]
MDMFNNRTLLKKLHSEIYLLNEEFYKLFDNMAAITDRNEQIECMLELKRLSEETYVLSDQYRKLKVVDEIDQLEDRQMEDALDNLPELSSDEDEEKLESNNRTWNSWMLPRNRCLVMITVDSHSGTMNCKSHTVLSSWSITVDLTEPVSGEVIDGVQENFSDLQFSPNPAKLGAQWKDYSDPESDINQYEIQVQAARSVII